MEVSNRIKTISNEVCYKKMADVGCDHGYISIYTSEIKKMEKIIALDINIEPLKSCKLNIKKYNLNDKIETRLGGGISKIAFAEVDTIVIAGVGGNLIIDILSEDILKTESFKQLVLQPQSNVSKVRKFIHSLDFKIINEEMVFEDGFYYNILNCKNGKEKPYSPEEYFFGKILLQKKSILLKDSLILNLEKLMALKNKILKNTNDISKVENKIIELDNKIQIINKYLEMRN